MYARGHARGTRRQTRQASRWYDTIAAATLARLEAAWPVEQHNAAQEVTSDKTQRIGSIEQAQGSRD